MPSFHDSADLEDFRKRHRLQPAKVSKLRTRYYRRLESSEELASELEGPARSALTRELDFAELGLVDRRDSEIDGASKLVFETADAKRIETVILRVKTGRTALCVSSQVGCAADCSFCATGRMGLRRNLTAEEIVDQLAQADRLLAPEERRVRNLVFMGMGEPLQNEDELHRALEMLLDPQRFGLVPGRVTVSTVGIPEAMLRLARRFPEVNQALSLHAALQETRERIIPLAKRHDLAEMKATLAEINRLSGKPVMLEYLMLAGLNDGAADLAALVEFCEGLEVHLNLIPFNAIEGGGELASTPKEGREAFGAALREAGLTVTLRYSLGSDVAAACGQLVREEERRMRDEKLVLAALKRSMNSLPWQDLLQGAGLPVPGSEVFDVEKVEREGDRLVATMSLAFDEAPPGCCSDEPDPAMPRFARLRVELQDADKLSCRVL